MSWLHSWACRCQYSKADRARVSRGSRTAALFWQQAAAQFQHGRLGETHGCCFFVCCFPTFLNHSRRVCIESLTVLTFSWYFTPCWLCFMFYPRRIESGSSSVGQLLTVSRLFFSVASLSFVAYTLLYILFVAACIPEGKQGKPCCHSTPLARLGRRAPYSLL